MPSGIAVSDGEIGELLNEAAERLAGSGVRIDWDEALDSSLSAKVVIGRRGGLMQSVPDVFDDTKLEGLSWELSLDGVALTEEEMEQLAETERPVTRLRDRWVLVSPTMSERARTPDLQPLSAIDALSVALTGTLTVNGETVEVEASGWIAALREQITTEGYGSNAIEPPEALTATLRE